MTVTTTGLGTISLVCVPTVEQDRAVEFYESLGFEKRTDEPFGGGYRWIEVYPPDGQHRHRARAAAAAGRRDVQPVQTGHHAHHRRTSTPPTRRMKELGVDVDAEVSRMGDPVPPMFWFRDPTGHTLMVVEQS